ncbi:MAG: C40 family peptidase [Duncaniella sp.]|nr:C40 family peptidase [Duncaniella sp.]
MKIRYIFTVLTLVVAMLVPLAGDAEQPVRKLPAAHADAASHFADKGSLMHGALANVRINSPFADLDKEPAKSVGHELEDLVAEMTDFAASFLGTRYRLGASGPGRFDCSGFTSYVFKKFGFAINRDSRSQYTQGEKVADGDLRPGDLMFFSSRSSGKGRVGHVGMVVDVYPDGTCKFIHASTKHGVVYQKFPDGAYYSRHYIGAKRLIGTM